MSKCLDLIGKKFGRLTVIKRVENVNEQSMWLCKCDCGNEVIVRGRALKSSNSKSCGCLTKDLARERFSTHKLSKTRLYKIWANVKARCNNPNTIRFYDYGGRGISLFKEWEDFATFESWALQTGYNDTLTIDRIDNNGNYEPNNCRWITPAMQSRNKRNNLVYTYNGKTLCLKDWAITLNIDYQLLYNRIIRRKWTFEKAITTPIMTNRRNKRATNR